MSAASAHLPGHQIGQDFKRGDSTLMTKQIPGQMSLFDIIKPKNDENLQKTAEYCKNLTLFDPCDYLTWCDWCAYQDKAKCCTYDEPLGRSCIRGSGFKPAKKLPKTRKKCGTCAHFFHYVSGLGEIYHGTACGKNRPWSVDKLPEDLACEQYQKRDDNSGLQ